MGFTTSAYAFYGIHIPSDQWAELSNQAYEEGERLDPIIRDVFKDADPGTPKVGHLAAGRYDDDMLFIGIDTGDSWEVGLGEYRVSLTPAAIPRSWDTALRAVANAAGYTGLEQPGWITVPSVD